jgi:hypothetical protein
VIIAGVIITFLSALARFPRSAIDCCFVFGEVGKRYGGWAVHHAAKPGA